MIKFQNLEQDNLFCNLKNDEKAFWLSSVGDDCCNIIIDIINNIFINTKIIYKAVGLPMNIQDNLDSFNDLKYDVFFGDSKKFCIKQFPEFLLTLPIKEVQKVIFDNWVCSVTEKRYLFFVDENNFHKMYEYLLSNVYRKKLDYKNFLEARIENISESDTNNTFVVIYKQNYHDKITKLINETIY